MFRYHIIASLPLMLCACSIQPSPPVQIPANLRQPCPALAPRPDPFVDPARLAWEVQLALDYADCAARHAGVVEAVGQQ